MRQNEDGAVVKRCQRCGRELVIENWYAAIATKYCKSCAADSKRQITAECLRAARAKARERRELEREAARWLDEENALLRERVRQLESRVRSYGRQFKACSDQSQTGK